MYYEVISYRNRESRARAPDPVKPRVLSFAGGLAGFAARHAGIPEHVLVATVERIPCRFREAAALLEHFPIAWNHVIEKESLKCKDLEHVLIEKVEQLFRDIL